MKFTSVDDIRDAQCELNFAIDAYLTSKGWRHTSDTPNCTWVWVKEWRGQNIWVNRATAVDMQDSMEANDTTREIKPPPNG
jgi:hypothetical protein